MNNVFTPPDRTQILDRLEGLQPGAARQWGTMDAAQVRTHCAIAMDMVTGDAPQPQRLIGKLLGRFFKGKLLGEAPFSKNSPTDPAFVMSDARAFATEKARLTALVTRFCDAGPSAADGRLHPFLGHLTGGEWGRMMWKNLDHHLRQFGV